MAMLDITQLENKISDYADTMIITS